MRKLMTLSLAAIALSLSVIAYTEVNNRVAAQDSKSKVEAPAEAGKDGSQGVDEVMLAESLAAWGRKNQHAGAVAVAGAILGKVPMKKADIKSEGSTGPGRTPDAAALVEEAKKMAGEDKDQLACVETIGKMGLKGRGATGGAMYGEGSCAGTKSKEEIGAVVYECTFKGGEVAKVGMAGEGTGELDLYIVDENKKIVASDESAGDTGLCQWTPAKNAKYYILIVNRTNKENKFVIVTN